MLQSNPACLCVIERTYELTEVICSCSGMNQAVYLMEALVKNILELGKPYSFQLLSSMPVSLVSHIPLHHSGTWSDLLSLRLVGAIGARNSVRNLIS